MKVRKSAALVGAALAVFCNSPAFATKADFELCDGLKAPKKDGDGMRPSVNRSFGLSPIAMTAAARINACTRALADPLLLPEHAIRKSNLLLARALGQIGNGAPDKAVDDLDLARTTSSDFLSDPKFARSMGVSLEIVHALALLEKGDLAQAQDTAIKAAALRPFSASVQQIVAVLLKRTTTGRSDRSPYAMVLPLSPDAATQQFGWLVETGRHKEAVALLPSLNLQFPAAPIGYPVEFGLSQPARQVTSSTITSMLAAYALSAAGEGERATALIESTRLQMTNALEIPQPASGVSAKSTLIEPLSRFIDEWAFLVTARQRVAKGETMDVVKSLVGRDLPDSLVVLDLFQAIRDALPEAQKSFAPPLEQAKSRLLEQKSKEDLNLSLIEKGLPPVELSNAQPAYRKSSKSLLGLLVGPVGYQQDGFRSSENASTGVITVEFLGNMASAVTVDEMTLLHAADLATQRGKTGFVIVERRDYSRTVTTTMGFSQVPISSAPAGFKTELDIRLVDLDSVQAGNSSDAGRVLDAKAVYASLAPIYLPPTEQGNSPTRRLQ